jgi:hypothetical protein
VKSEISRIFSTLFFFNRTLDAEEAEEKFAERSKTLNHWSALVQKKLRPDQPDDGTLDDDLDDKKGKKKGGNFF